MAEAGWQKIPGRYFADGFLLEGALALADTDVGSPAGRLLYHSDRAVLYIALAAEAHINHAIETGLSGAAQEAAAGLRTGDKLRLVPGLAGAEVTFEAGREPLQGLNSLIGRRNALVHAKPNTWEIETTEDGRLGSMKIHPDSFGTPIGKAAGWLLSLCEYLDQLADSGVEAWKDHAYLARELLRLKGPLRVWDPTIHADKLRRVATELVDANFEDEHYEDDPS